MTFAGQEPWTTLRQILGFLGICVVLSGLGYIAFKIELITARSEKPGSPKCPRCEKPLAAFCPDCQGTVW